MMKYTYFAATLLSAIFAVLSTSFKSAYAHTLKKSDKNLSRLFAFLSFIPLTFVSAVRYGIGTDFFSYQNVFNQNAEMYRYQEPGFWLLVKGIKYIGSDPQICFAAISVLTGASYFWLIYKESENAMFSVILYVLSREFFLSTTALRQYMAMSILLFAIPLIRKGGFFKWLFVILIACIAYTFHNSTIAVLPLYLLFILNPAPWLSGFIVFAAFAVPILATDIIRNSVGSLTKYAWFLEELDPGFESSTFLAFLFVFIFVMLVIKYDDKKDRASRLLYNAMIFGMSVLAFAGSAHWVAIRVSYYAHPFIVIYLPHVINKIKPKWFRVVIYIIFFIGFLATCTYITLGGNATVLGYKTFWQV